MRRFVAVLVLLAFCAPGRAEITVKAKAVYAPYEPIVLRVEGVTGAKTKILWDVSEGAQYLKAGACLHVWAPPGRYVVRLTVIDFEKGDAEQLRVGFAVGDAPPGPTPPGPDPPGPGPKPSPAPISRAGLHVLIVYDPADTQLPAGQNAVLYGKAVRDWLEANCTSDPANAQWKAYRIWPKTADASKDDPVWQGAFNRPRGSTPWVVISNPAVGGFEGALPATPEAFLALAQKYAGAKLRKAG